MNKHRSPVWNFFSVYAIDSKYAVCNLCNKRISCGSSIAKKRTTCSMKLHLKNYHQEEFNQINYESSSAITSQTLDLNINSSQETSYNNSQPIIGNKRSATDSNITSIFSITTKKQRSALLRNSIPGWIETNSIWDLIVRKLKKVINLYSRCLF